MERPIAVRAAELLRKAEVQERTAPNVPRRIRIRWKSHSWTRSGRLDASLRPESGAPTVLRAMLVNAGFDWEDPLSAAAFSRWRNSLPERHDDIRNEEGSYVVTTSTPAGVLSEASLTLRAGDLHAVSATLRYRSQETLEMMEVGGNANELEVGQPRPPVPELIPRTPEAPTLAGVAEEVQVIAALHRIGADLGEPIDVQRTPEGIRVSGSGLSAVRQEQIRASVVGVPGVRVAFEANRGRRLNGAELPLRTTPPADATNPLLDELRAAAANPDVDAGDALIDATDRAVQRSYALEALARRFPQPGESALTEGDRAVVRRI